MKKNDLINHTVSKHKIIYGCEPMVVSFAPGRIEVLGNHTDYNLGITLSSAINKGVCFAISKSNKKNITVNALDFKECCSFNSNDLKKVKKFNWANYIKGVFYYFNCEKVKCEGLNCTFAGSIPMGAGLSSSAALEVATSFAIQEYCKSSLNLKEIAKISQKAEQNFAGCKCGLLDQYSSIYGKKNKLILSDFKTHEINTVNISKNAIFLMVNTNTKHELSSSPYNERRQSCFNAVKELSIYLKREICSLRDVSYDEFTYYKKFLTPLSAQRSEHIVSEIQRVNKALIYLDNDQVEKFGNLMYESHNSSIKNFENSCNELDIVVDIAKKNNAVGARLSGGGWGGSVIVLTTQDKADILSDKILEDCTDKGINASISKIMASEGAHIIKGYK